MMTSSLKHLSIDKPQLISTLAPDDTRIHQYSLPLLVYVMACHLFSLDIESDFGNNFSAHCTQIWKLNRISMTIISKVARKRLRCCGRVQRCVTAPHWAHRWGEYCAVGHESMVKIATPPCSPHAMDINFVRHPLYGLNPCSTALPQILSFRYWQNLFKDIAHEIFFQQKYLYYARKTFFYLTYIFFRNEKNPQVMFSYCDECYILSSSREKNHIR